MNLIADKILVDVLLDKRTRDRIMERVGIAVTNGHELMRSVVTLLDMNDRQAEMLQKFMGNEESVEPSRCVENKKDDVIHPKHYCQEGSMECIDEMLLIFGEEETKIYCKLAAWKYRKRLLDKDDPVKDMRKSDAYLRCFKAIKEEGVARFE